MVYKKFIKRGDKFYGPYNYKSKRQGNKVLTEYVGKHKGFRRADWSWLIIFSLLIISVIFFLSSISNIMEKSVKESVGSVIRENLPVYQINKPIIETVASIDKGFSVFSKRVFLSSFSLPKLFSDLRDWITGKVVEDPCGEITNILQSYIPPIPPRGMDPYPTINCEVGNYHYLADLNTDGTLNPADPFVFAPHNGDAVWCQNWLDTAPNPCADCGDGNCEAGEYATTCPSDCAPSCTPNCAGKNCGSNGCGGSCGECGEGQTCISGTCQFEETVDFCNTLSSLLSSIRPSGHEPGFSISCNDSKYDKRVDFNTDGFINPEDPFVLAGHSGDNEWCKSQWNKIFNPCVVCTPDWQCYAWSTCRVGGVGCQGDLNSDGKINEDDMNLFKKSYGSKQGDANWNPLADLNNDTKCDILDMGLISNKLGRSCVQEKRVCIDSTNCSLNKTETRECTNEEEYERTSKCTERWVCDWASCVNGTSYPINCNETNKCGSNYSYPKSVVCQEKPIIFTGTEGPGCSPIVNCSEWSECGLNYSLSGAEGQVLIGFQQRKCIDIADCTKDFIETQSCSFSVPIKVVKTSPGGIDIYDRKTSELLSKITKTELIKYPNQTRTDVVFLSPSFKEPELAPLVEKKKYFDWLSWIILGLWIMFGLLFIFLFRSDFSKIITLLGEILFMDKKILEKRITDWFKE